MTKLPSRESRPLDSSNHTESRALLGGAGIKRIKCGGFLDAVVNKKERGFEVRAPGERGFYVTQRYFGFLGGGREYCESCRCQVSGGAW